MTTEIYAIGDVQQGVIIHGRAGRITDGVEQRDSGYRHGSLGASTFIIRYDRLLFPGLWNLDKMHPEFAEYVRGSGMREGDVLIIAGSDDRTIARYSAVSVALELL